MFLRLLSVFFLVAFSAIPSSAGDPFNGKWRLEQGKTRITGAHVQSIEIEAAESEAKFVYQGVDAEGQPVEWQIRTSIGGNLSGVIDVPWLDAVKCWRSDSRTVLIKLFRSAVNIGFDTMELSKDGKSLRLTHAMLDAKGKEIKTITSFAKQ